ncbi:hypothetical protein FQR65_LT03635 [Abscondita terminalis]|nr:hypothetical protein FQR65_LT03635 [Abscondita terminalis]
MKWLAFCVLTVVLVTLAVADGEIWEEDDHEVLIRSERGAKNRGKLLFIISVAFNLGLSAINKKSSATPRIGNILNSAIIQQHLDLPIQE